MRRYLIVLIIGILLAGCFAQTKTALPSTPHPASDAQASLTPGSDFFSKMGIAVSAPASCNGLTPAQTEGPYYTPDTPERNSLLQAGMKGRKLILAGYVLDQNCNPLSNVWLDFWQADADGVYDNQGYTLRGHQFTDGEGRYYLETVRPGEYPGRTEHIHVKIQSSTGNMLTSQLYFPDVSANQQDGIFNPALIVQLEDRGDYLLATFNFVVLK